MNPAAGPPIETATAAAIDRAGALIRNGRLVAFPTETVYGLGADATNGTAVAALFEAKDRPQFNPLIVHVPGLMSAFRLVEVDGRCERLAARFWPGALTMVLPRSPDCPVSELACAGLETLAVRAPDHAVAQGLLATSGCPIAAPSANLSGEVSPTTARHVAVSLGDRVDMVLDGGPCRVGIESTVLDLSARRARILRPGGITAEDIADVIGPLAAAAPEGAAAPASPGMLESHYATYLALRTDATELRPGEALLAFGPEPLEGAVEVQNLSPAGDLIEAAANLFAMMRLLDRPEHSGIAVMKVPDEGLGRAINDRLRRAAH